MNRFFIKLTKKFVSRTYVKKFLFTGKDIDSHLARFYTGWTVAEIKRIGG